MSLQRFVAFRLAPFLLMLCACAAGLSLVGGPGNVMAEEDQDSGNSILRKTSYYSVNVTWPVLGIDRVDEESRAYAKSLADAFLAEIDEVIAEIGEMPESEAADLYRSPRELSVSYEVEEASSLSVGILWNIYSYTGGAHGMLDMTSNNYNRENGFPLLLEDLFLDPDLALVLFSRESRNKLAQPDDEGNTIPDDMLRAGTEALEENFGIFIITPKGLRLHFPPYQVAPWAAGPQQVDVSLETLAPAKPRLEYWGQ